MRRTRKIVKIKPSTHADGRGYDPTPQVFPTLDHEVRTRFIVSSRSSFAWGEFRRVARRYVDNGGKTRTLQGDTGGTRYEDPR